MADGPDPSPEIFCGFHYSSPEIFRESATPDIFLSGGIIKNFQKLFLNSPAIPFHHLSRFPALPAVSTKNPVKNYLPLPGARETECIMENESIVFHGSLQQLLEKVETGEMIPKRCRPRTLPCANFLPHTMSSPAPACRPARARPHGMPALHVRLCQDPGVLRDTRGAARTHGLHHP